jgi:hypothetical protein
MNQSEISIEIEKVEQQLSELREKLKKSETKTPREAKIGDKLADGSIVVETFPNAILVVAPKETEYVINSTDVLGDYILSFDLAFGKISYSNSHEWFAPSLEILESSMRKVPDAFNEKEYYISTTKITPTTQSISASGVIQHGFVYFGFLGGPGRRAWRYFHSSNQVKRGPKFKIHQRLFRFIAF